MHLIELVLVWLPCQALNEVLLLADENVAYDINGYNKAPPSIRIWGGGTVENSNIKLLLPWLDWSYNKIKNNV